MLILEICFCTEVSKKRGVLNLLFAAHTTCKCTFFSPQYNKLIQGDCMKVVITETRPCTCNIQFFL